MAKVNATFSISQECNSKLELLAEKTKSKKSQLIELFISKAYENLQTEIANKEVAEATALQ